MLDGIAGSLIRGDIARAQLLALQLRLPDLDDETGPNRLLKADELLRFNPNHDNQGRFASAPGDGGGRSATHTNKTPGGTRYSTALHLSAKQSEMLGRIVDYGVAHGFRPDQISIAVN